MPRRTSPAQLANLKRGHIKPPKTTQSVTFELDRELLAEIDRVAEEKKISRAAEIRLRLEQHPLE